MDTAPLQEFIITVPTCVETDSLVNIWQLFRAGCDRVVVVDEQQIPLGTLSPHQLVRCLPVNAPEEALIFSESTPELDRHSLTRRYQDHLQLFLNQKNKVHSILDQLEPITPLPVDWTISQFQSYLPEIGRRQWVLVNSVGQYMGLLDRLQLLQFLVAHLPDRSTQGQSTQATSHAPPSRLEATLSDVRLPPRATQPTTETRFVAPPSINPPTVIDPLIDLLERLPIPLMLQTTAGRIITQNLAWRQQVSELRDPGQIAYEAATILESVDRHASSASSLNHPTAETGSSTWSFSGLGSNFFPVKEYQSEAASTPTPYGGFCRLSPDPNSCVCICPMKNGQDCVWKFLKVPMGIASSHLNHPRSGSPPSSPQFKLAAFGFSPDPEWRSLAQTEFLWLVLAQDITEQHQIAKELAAKNADLVQLNRLKDEFLSCISHELKTPLTAVLGLSSLLKDQALGKLNERQSRYARLIHQSGRHLISIVNDILDLTRIETGQLDLTLEPVQIESVCLNAHQQARQMHAIETHADAQPDSPEQTIAFSLDIQPGLEHLVADELRLRQMLFNLLSNALKFTEPGGRIGLRVEDWEGWVAFTVWDTGIGIPPDKQHLIFQKFQQLENPLTRQFEGTGLGLVLTQRLARLHGGDVTFTSVEAEGSEFTLLLPPSPPQATTPFPFKGKSETKKGHQSPSISSRSRLMLVVEADPKLIEDLSRQLVGLGYRVAIARSGTEALEKIRRLQPGVVFLNPILPLLSGWDVLTLLKADKETQHIPIVVTATRVEREQAYQTGANGFLSLPIREESLQRCLDRLTHQTTREADHRSPSLTVLHLREIDESSTIAPIHCTSPPPSQDLSSLLHSYHCRVLEVHDLEQANLLARVWKPNVMLMDGSSTSPLAYVKQLSSYPDLAALPLVTLTAEITHAANLVPGLAVFPCLAQSSLSDQDADSQEVAELWQVIQIAAGIHWTPHILITEMSALEENWALAAPFDWHQPVESPILEPSKSLNALQALVHYMQIAGFRSSVGHSWQQVVHQLEHHSVDLLLLCVHSSSNLHPIFLDIVQTLEKLEAKPPILVWNYRTDPITTSSQEPQNLQIQWGTIATEVLPVSLSMPELLNRINQTLTHRSGN